MIFQTFKVSISKGNIKEPIGKSTFYTKFYVQTLPIFSLLLLTSEILNTICISLYYIYHKLVKFEQNRMIGTTQNL